MNFRGRAIAAAARYNHNAASRIRSHPEVANMHCPSIFVAICLTLFVTSTPTRSEEEAGRAVEDRIESILQPTGKDDEKRQERQALLSKSAEAVPILRARLSTELQSEPIRVGPVLQLIRDFGPAASGATSEVIECIARTGRGWGTLAAIAGPDLAVWSNRLNASDDSASAELLRRIAGDPATAESILVKAFDDEQVAASQRLIAGVALYRGGLLSTDRQVSLLAVYKEELARQSLEEKPSMPSVEVWDLPDRFSIAQWMARHDDDWIRLRLCDSPLPQAARPIVLDMLDYRSSKPVLGAVLGSIEPLQNSWEVRHFMGVVFDPRLPSDIRLDALGALCAEGQLIGEGDAIRLLDAIVKPPEGIDQDDFNSEGVLTIIHPAGTRDPGIRFGEHDFESRFLKKAFFLIDRFEVSLLCGRALLLETSGGKELFRGWMTDGDPEVQRMILGVLGWEPEIAKEFRREIRLLIGNQRPDDLLTGLSAASIEFAITQDFEGVRSVFEAALGSADASVRAAAVALLPSHRDSVALVAQVLWNDPSPTVRLEVISQLATRLSPDEVDKFPPTPAVWSAVFSNTRYENEVGDAARRYLDESEPDLLASAEGVLRKAIRHESPLVREEALNAAGKLVAMNSLSLYFDMLAEVKSDSAPLFTWREVLHTTLGGTLNAMNNEGAQSPKSLHHRLSILSDSSEELSQIFSAIKAATTHEDEEVRKTAEELHGKLQNSLK